MAELISTPARSGGRQKNSLPVRVDLTALVDLAFLLITFFMLTTTLSRVRNLPLVIPEKADIRAVDWVPQSCTMTICLGKNDRAMWYLGMIDKPLIAPKLSAFGNDLGKVIKETAAKVFKKTGGSLVVIIKPSRHSVYKNLVNTLDELNITQTSSYAITDITASDITVLKQKGIY